MALFVLQFPGTCEPLLAIPQEPQEWRQGTLLGLRRVGRGLGGGRRAGGTPAEGIARAKVCQWEVGTMVLEAVFCPKVGCRELGREGRPQPDCERS